MPSTSFLIFAGIIMVFLVLGVIFLLPSEKGPAAARKKRPKEEEENNKDWQAVSLRLEKHIHKLRQEISALQGNEKILERNILIEKGKYAKLQEKLSQERGWQKKELTDVERKSEQLIRLREELKTTEQHLAQEHGKCLQFDRETKELNDALAAANDVKRSVESQMARMEAQLDADRKELSTLKAENAQLTRKHDESTWISKSEYVKLEERLRNTEKEFARFKDQLRREKV